MNVPVVGKSDEVLGRVGKVIYDLFYPSLTFIMCSKSSFKGSRTELSSSAEMKNIVVLKIQQHVAEDDWVVLKELYKYFKDDLEFEIIDGAVTSDESSLKTSLQHRIMTEPWYQIFPCFQFRKLNRSYYIFVMIQ